MFTRAIPSNPPLEIKLDKPYLRYCDFSKIEKKVEQSLSENSPLIIDFTDVSDGVQGDFYGILLGTVQNFYTSDADIWKYLNNNLLLRFESKRSKAYEKLRQGYTFFFKTSFVK